MNDRERMSMDHRNILAAAAAAVMIISFAGCSAKETEEESSAAESSANESVPEKAKEKLRASTSSLQLPLGMNEWGSAAKYSVSENKYHDVPVKITGMVCGSEADKKIREILKKDPSGYKYTEPGKDSKWALIDYTLSLDGFPLDEGGEDASVTSFVTAEDGGYLKSGGKDTASVTMDLFEKKYYFEGTVSGQIAVLIPAECKKFILTLGEYDETQAFFALEP